VECGRDDALAAGVGLGRCDVLGVTIGVRPCALLDPDDPVVKTAITPASAMSTLAAPRTRTMIGEGCIGVSQPGPLRTGL
jgi:hypothetical protein